MHQLSLLLVRGCYVSPPSWCIPYPPLTPWLPFYKLSDKFLGVEVRTFWYPCQSWNPFLHSLTPWHLPRCSPHLPWLHAWACNYKWNSKTCSVSASTCQHSRWTRVWNLWNHWLQDWLLPILQTTLPCPLAWLWEYQWRIILASCHGTQACKRPSFQLPLCLSQQTQSDFKVTNVFLFSDSFPIIHSAFLILYFFIFLHLHSFSKKNNFILQTKLATKNIFRWKEGPDHSISISSTSSADYPFPSVSWTSSVSSTSSMSSMPILPSPHPHPHPPLLLFLFLLPPPHRAHIDCSGFGLVLLDLGPDWTEPIGPSVQARARLAWTSIRGSGPGTLRTGPQGQTYFLTEVNIILLHVS